MGITFAKLFQRLFSKKEMRILMVRANFCAFFLMALSSEVANKERISTRRHDFPELKFVQDGGFTGGIETNLRAFFRVL